VRRVIRRSGFVSSALRVNIALAVSFLPILFTLVLVSDPFASLPFFVAMAVMCAPGLAAALGLFAQMSRPATEHDTSPQPWAQGDDEGRVFGPFFRAYRHFAGAHLGSRLCAGPSSWSSPSILRPRSAARGARRSARSSR
jgi:hypothetical protein